MLRNYQDVSELFYLELRGFSRKRLYDALKQWSSQKSSVEKLSQKLALLENTKLNSKHIDRASRAIDTLVKKYS